jgi:signal transduction histidine kinase
MTAPARPWRLSARLAWRLAAVMSASVALVALAVAWRALATLRSLDDATLQAQARLVAERLIEGPDGMPRLADAPALRAAFSSHHGGGLFLVSDVANTPLIASDARAGAILGPYLPRPPETGLFRVPASAAFPRGLAGVLIADGRWRVAAAQAREPDEALVNSLLGGFLFGTLWFVVPIGLATVAIGVLTIRSGLRPLRAASAAAAAVGPAAPGLRLPTEGLPRELVPLVAAVNDALARLAQALDAQRRFTGEAAHALRTPLAVLMARIDALPSDPDQAALRADVDRLARLVGQMLVIARLDGLPLDRSRLVDLRALAAKVVAALAPLAIRHGVDLALTGAERLAPVHADAAALETALENLVDNAIAHAPAGSAVEVELLAPASLRVLDRGAGIAPGEQAAVFERFHSRRSGGAGLGLAIVARVAAAHGGSARAESRPGGGSIFVLDLPAR